MALCECSRASSSLSKYSEPVYNRFWFSPECEALQALITDDGTNRDRDSLG